MEGVLTGEGLFDGTITTGEDTLYVEPVSRYLVPGELPSVYSSVLYRLEDVRQPSAPCASALLRRRRQAGVFYFDSDAYEIRRTNRSDIIVKRPSKPKVHCQFTLWQLV